MEQNEVSNSAVGSNHSSIGIANNVGYYSADSDDACSKAITTPKETRYWLSICDDAYKPVIGQCFGSFEDGFHFYEEYGRVCGFDVRRSTTKNSRNGTTILKYYVCHREGTIEKKVNKCDYIGGEISKQGRKMMFTRCDCKAMIGLKLLGHEERGGVFVYKFVELHTHKLVASDCRHFLRSGREMTLAHKNFAFDASKVKIGASQAHGLMKELVGGYENVGATVRDFRNWSRDLKHGIGEKDAQIILDKFKAKKDETDSFYYEYEVDESCRLTKLFWADPIGRRNYQVFGDVISFDATFGTNKYNMVFVPFCCVDNHRKCVTFAPGLLSREDIPYYTWVFRAFLNAMGREPLCLLTDQCPAMKQAIPAVFTSTRHRWCMWHIMNKLPSKVGPHLCKEADLMSKIKCYVWGEILNPSEFEEGWKAVIQEYGLEDNEWLSIMYENRSRWIPAYFRDDPLLGILRTTSWSKSANAFFGKYTKDKDTLTEFYIRFETAMEKQRQTNRRMNHECLTKLPKAETPLLIEKDAAEIYTREIFYMVQNEIKESCYNLGLKLVSCDDSVKNLVLTDGKANGKEFEVKHVLETNHLECSCKQFERIGILCRHAFFTLKLVNVGKIPRDHVLNRWTKNAERRVSSSVVESVSTDCASVEAFGSKVNDIWFDFKVCIGLAGKDGEDLDHIANVVKDLKHELRERRGTNVCSKNKTVIENLIGAEIPDEITVKPPNEGRNKGCGRKRIMDAKEKSVVQKEKAKRLCRSCNQMVHHDKRNCPLLFEDNN